MCPAGSKQWDFISPVSGIPERVISLTTIAFGTSLPELITSLTASIKGYHGLSIGILLVPIH